MAPVALGNDKGRRDDSGFDFSMVARGASAGLTILLLGGLIAPVVVSLAPLLGFIWLPLVALGAFVLASWRGTTPESPVLQGSLAAVAGYLLVLPLVFLGSGGVDAVQVLATIVTAVVAGGAGVLARRRLEERRRRRAEMLDKVVEELPPRPAEGASDEFAEEAAAVTELRLTPRPQCPTSGRPHPRCAPGSLSEANAVHSGCGPASEGR
jgi:hypothetical protein